MKKTKAEKGITLIALIITIIVLIILAVVTIQAVQEHGIIGYAKNAQTEYDKKAEEENSTLQGYATHLKEQTFKWRLDEGGETVTRDNVTLNIGDYVDYTPDGDATYPTTKLTEAITGSSSNSSDITRDTGLKWRVFGVDSNGYLTLISNQETSQLVYLEGATGYNNGVYVLNDICEKLYSNSSTLGIKARSLTIEDVEGGLSDTGKANRDKFTYFVTYGKDNCSSPYASGFNQYPILYEQEKGSGTTGTIRKGGIGVSDPYYTEEQLTTRENESVTASENLACTQTFYLLWNDAGNFKSEKFKEMFFLSSWWYWLASRACRPDQPSANFGFRIVNQNKIECCQMFRSDGTSLERSYYLRPAISLGSDIVVKPCDGPNSVDNMHTLEKAS